MWVPRPGWGWMPSGLGEWAVLSGGKGGDHQLQKKKKKKNVSSHNRRHAAKDGKLSFFRDGAKSS